MSFLSFNQFKAQYEGLKATHVADLTTVENCLGKCNVDFDGEATFSNKEVNCLKTCYTKYFDSGLLIEKEMKHYVHGMPL